MPFFFAVGTYFWSRQKEKKFDNDLKQMLYNELFSNLLIINSNLKIIEEFEKNPKTVYKFIYICDNIFRSLLSTNRINIVGIELVFLISNFYNEADTVSTIMQQSGVFEEIKDRKDEDGKSSLVKKTFIDMKIILKKIAKKAGLWSKFEEWETKGIKEYQDIQNYE